MFLVKHCARGNYTLLFEMLISCTASALPARAANPLMPGCYLCWHSSQTVDRSPPHPSSIYRTGWSQEDVQGCNKKCLHAVNRGRDAASSAAAPGSPLPSVEALTAMVHHRNLAQKKTSPRRTGAVMLLPLGSEGLEAIPAFFFCFGRENENVSLKQTHSSLSCQVWKVTA